MGKRLIIPGADFSENALEIALFKTVSPNTSFQIKDSTVINAQSNVNGIYEHEGTIEYSGSSGSITLFNVVANQTQPAVEEISGLRLKTGSLTWALSNCLSLKKVIFGSIEQTQEDISLRRFLEGSTNIEELSFPKSTIISISDISYALRGGSKIKHLDLSMFDTQNLIGISYFLMGLSGEVTAIKELNLSGWDLSSLDISSSSNYQSAFYGCTNLKKVIVNDCDASTITKLKTILATSGLTYTDGTDSDGNAVLIGA